MKYLTISLLLATSLFASKSAITFYKESKDNHLLCKFSENSYKIINNKNSKLIKINGSDLFKINGENVYINSSGCHIITDTPTAIIF